ncbi:hypothetical protein BGY98DRAFT_968215 [Russula aff. rugulosa BPL654]|nr:hypothetical protein BGY98DRAFT_968215 [Russula aff. rugulosa BPL654]
MIPYTRHHACNNYQPLQMKDEMQGTSACDAMQTCNSHNRRMKRFYPSRRHFLVSLT